MFSFLNDAVVEGYTVVGRFLQLFLLALTEFFEGCSEFLGHEVINNRVDGTIKVNANPTEQQEPMFLERLRQEGVNDHQGPVGHPQEGKKDYNHGQHLCNLWEVNGHI